MFVVPKISKRHCSTQASAIKNPRVFFDVEIGGKKSGRVVFE
jgi:hypothetical protein